METVKEIVMLPLSEVRPYENNPRQNSKTVDLLVRIIPQVGFNVPLVLDKDHVIVKGHARYLAAQRLGMAEVPCVISDADPEAIKADRIADNKVFEFSTWINDELMHELDMLDIDFDPEAFGLPNMSKAAEEMPAFDFEDDEDFENPADAEERRQRYEAMMRQMEQEAEPVEIVTRQQVEHAKMKQRSEAEAPPEYFAITCEKCGRVMYVRKGDEETWE